MLSWSGWEGQFPRSSINAREPLAALKMFWSTTTLLVEPGHFNELRRSPTTGIVSVHGCQGRNTTALSGGQDDVIVPAIGEIASGDRGDVSEPFGLTLRVVNRVVKGQNGIDQLTARRQNEGSVTDTRQHCSPGPRSTRHRKY